jgi:hypothetical protein
MVLGLRFEVQSLGSLGFIKLMALGLWFRV